MPEWSLIDRPGGGPADGIAGFAVLDALGLPLGRVTGWVEDPDGRLRMIKLSVRGWFDTSEYLVPVGAVTLVDNDRMQFHLRELTSRTIRKYCITLDGELPESRLLKTLIRYFPNPRPSVVERLESLKERVPDPLARAVVGSAQEDGARQAEAPEPQESASRWMQLARHVLPDWNRLNTIGPDSGGEY